MSPAGEVRPWGVSRVPLFSGPGPIFGVGATSVNYREGGCGSSACCRSLDVPWVGLAPRGPLAGSLLGGRVVLLTAKIVATRWSPLCGLEALVQSWASRAVGSSIGGFVPLWPGTSSGRVSVSLLLGPLAWRVVVFLAPGVTPKVFACPPFPLLRGVGQAACWPGRKVLSHPCWPF